MTSSQRQARDTRQCGEVALAAWPCAQQTSQWQRAGRYVAESNEHPAKMLPSLARQAIEHYSDPGDLVVDPMCGIGTTVVEAAHLGRRAVGVELEERWALLARKNVALARGQGAAGEARIVQGDARGLPRLLAEARSSCDGRVVDLPFGGVDLVVMSPPYACDVGRPNKERSGRHELCPAEQRNYSSEKSNLGHARGRVYLEAMAAIYETCARVIRPGGYVVVVTKNMRSGGALRNLAGDTIALCERAGLQYWQHVIALLATLRDGELIPRPSFWQRLQIRRACERGERPLLVCHEDVLVFRRPREATAAAAAASPTRRAA